MPAPKSNRNAKGNRGGRPTLYKPDFAAQAEKACRAGFTDQELADLFGVSVRTLNSWKARHLDFLQALKAGKTEAVDRVERALYHRAVGYSHSVETPMVVDKDVRMVTYTERMPPDTTACIFWLKNRRPDEWRDKVVQEMTCLVAGHSWDQVRWALEEHAWRFERLGARSPGRR